MNKLILITSFLFFTSCVSLQNSSVMKDQEGNLVGIVNKKDFQKEPFSNEWFNEYYSYYETDTSTINKLKPLLKNITIKGFMGTWCDDSKREIPNFYKILEDSKFELDRVELIAVNKNKKAKGLEKGFTIKRVPTFIFYKNGKEIGRFVEHSVNGATLEHDILQIISESGYKHTYYK